MSDKKPPQEKNSPQGTLTQPTENEFTGIVDVSTIENDSDLTFTGFNPNSLKFNARNNSENTDFEYKDTIITTKATKSYLPNGMKMINQYLMKKVIGVGSYGKAVLVEDTKTKKRKV